MRKHLGGLDDFCPNCFDVKRFDTESQQSNFSPDQIFKEEKK